MEGEDRPELFASFNRRAQAIEMNPRPSMVALFGKAAYIVQVSGMGTILRQWYLEGAQDIQNSSFLGPDIQW